MSGALTIDASGDADVIAMAGLPHFVGEHGRVQNPTMIFRLQGVDMDRFLSTYGSNSIMGEPMSTKIQKLNSGNEYRLPRSKIFLFPTPRPRELLCNATRILGSDGRELNPLLAEDLSEAEMSGRRQVRNMRVS